MDHRIMFGRLQHHLLNLADATTWLRGHIWRLSIPPSFTSVYMKHAYRFYSNLLQNISKYKLCTLFIRNVQGGMPEYLNHTCRPFQLNKKHVFLVGIPRLPSKNSRCPRGFSFFSRWQYVNRWSITKKNWVNKPVDPDHSCSKLPLRILGCPKLSKGLRQEHIWNCTLWDMVSLYSWNRLAVLRKL